MTSRRSDLDTIFVVGAPRSGTTLLQRCISVHSALFSLPGETGLFSYQNIFEPERKHFGLAANELQELFASSTDLVDFFDQGVRRITLKNDNKRFVEKTPQHILHIPFIIKHFPNALVVHIVRDGRDCFCSSKTHPCMPQNTSASTFAKYWRKCVRVVMCNEEHDQLMNVRYEDFVRNPEGELSNIMRFLGLEVESAQLDPVCVGADARADLAQFSKLNSPINSSSSGRWAKELDAQEVSQFEQFAEKELLHFGYGTCDRGSA